MVKERSRLYSIRIAAQQAGVTPFVIRAWERRHRAVTPARSDHGQRRYSDADIHRLARLRRAVESGHRIGDIAHLDDTALDRLAVQPVPPAASAAPTPRPGSSEASGWLEQCLEAVSTLNGELLEAILRRASVELSRPFLLEGLAAPLLARLGTAWERGELRIAHEHLASATLTRFLGQLLTRPSAPAAAPVIVIATPPGHQHGLGALLASVAAADEGWSVLYLGPDIPAEELANAVKVRDARAVGLSIVYTHDGEALRLELERLREMLPVSVPIFLGGAATTRLKPGDLPARVFLPADLAEFRQLLRAVR